MPLFTPGPIYCITSESQRTPERVPPYISYASITDWINRTNPYLGSPDESDPVSQLSLPLKVIDSTTRNLILLPENEPYATLSYVWGHGDDDPGDDEPKLLPRELPSTIEDCIAVCSALNFRYLWVDRYCIYGDVGIRAQQIKEMDKVYSESVLTIIACAGVDATYGLAGVSRPRIPYPSLEVKDLGSLWAPPSLEDVKNSKWATRGWTFQEGMLSKRLLYFTDKQLFLGLHDTIESESRRWESNAIADMMIKNQYTLGNWPTYHCLGMYSQRCLSRPEDILNAILGILSQFRKDREVFHLWGLPFRGHGRAKTNALGSPFELVLAKSLCWHPFKPTRREGYPTWSWTSNDGRVYWAPNLPLSMWYEESDPESVPQFEVELMSGELCSLSEFQLRYDDLNDYSEVGISRDRPSRFIQIHAFVSPVIDIKTNGDLTTIGVESTTDEPIFFDSRCNTLSTSISHESALVIHLVYGRHAYSRHALLVVNMGSHWERIGAINDSLQELDRAAKFRKKLRLG